MKRISRFLFILCAVIMLTSYSLAVNAASPTPIDDFEYTLSGPGTMLLTKYTGEGQSVTVPACYFVDGINYQVSLASQTVFAGNSELTSVTICSGVSFEEMSMTQLFAKCTALQTVKINADTSNVIDMSYLFYGCEELERIDLSGLSTDNVTTMKGMFSNCSKLETLVGYEKWNTQSLVSIAYMFNLTRKLQVVDLSHWDLSNLRNSGWCFQNCGASKICLPDNLAVISAGFLNHATGYTDSSFTVPSGVKKIGYAHTIYDFATENFTEFRVAEGNEAYKAIDGILYSSDTREMLAIPRGKEFPDGIYEIPEGVTFLGELSFSRNYHIETVILPDSYILKYVPFYDPAYITFEDTGNLNAGLNLNIAIYSYTGIKAYQVKSSNPNYKSIDGVLYSKDGSAVVAIPTRYEGMLKIPEGVTLWQPAAMWNAGETVDAMMKNCTGVSIPATLTEIAQDQVDKLNRLEERYSGFEITVSENNPIYYTGKSGQLLKKSNLDDLQITLLQDAFVFDGQPKTPDVTAFLNGKLLKAGENYTVSYFNNINAGIGWVLITGQGDYYGTVESSFVIETARPDYTVPVGLTAVYGQRLAEIALPDGFIWMQPDTVIEETGINSFAATYANGDPNYVAIQNIPVIIRVQSRPIDTSSICTALWNPWTGKVVEPYILVVDNAGIVPENAYTVTYENNVHCGKGRAVLQDVPGGNYTVSGTVEFYIVPGPFLCTVVLTILWCLTTGLSLRKDRKAVRSGKLQKNL